MNFDYNKFVFDFDQLRSEVKRIADIIDKTQEDVSDPEVDGVEAFNWNLPCKMSVTKDGIFFYYSAVDSSDNKPYTYGYTIPANFFNLSEAEIRNYIILDVKTR